MCVCVCIYVYELKLQKTKLVCHENKKKQFMSDKKIYILNIN